MTTPDKKEAERRTLSYLLEVLDFDPDTDPSDGEAPDFVVQSSGRTIGIEITSFQSGTTTDDGVELRKVEGEWQNFEASAEEFRQTRPHLHDLNVGLFFKTSMLPRSDYSAFMEEIAAFAQDRLSDLGSEGQDYWTPNFASPLMNQYLRHLHLRRSDYPEWFSNFCGGWIGGPDRALTTIITKKAGKVYRPTDELWLAIQCSPRPSEMMMTIEGAADFGDVAGLEDALLASPFSRVLVLTYGGAYEWNRSGGWRQHQR